MGVGSYAINQQSVTSVNIPAGITTLGALLLLATIFGFFAACKESKANTILLTTYVIVLAILMVCLLFVGTAVAVSKDNAQQYVLQGYQGLNVAGKVTLQNAQNCCGGMVFNDTDRGDPCPTAPGSQRGCVPILTQEFNSVFNTAGACGISFAAIIFVGLLISGYLLHKARLGYNESTYKTHDDSGLQAEALQ